MTEDYAVKMDKAVQLLEASLLGIRGGAITSGVIDALKVLYFGQMTPIKHLAHTSDSGGKVMIVPFDAAMLGEISKALTNAGFNAYVFSKTSVAVSTNSLSGAERDKVKTLVRKLGEDAKVSVRGIRKQARQKIDAGLSKDDKVKAESEIQTATSQVEARIDRIINAKIENIG